MTINAEENLDRRSDDEIEGDCLGTLPKTEAEDSDQERTKPLLFRSIDLITLPKMSQTRQCLNVGKT